MDFNDDVHFVKMLKKYPLLMPSTNKQFWEGIIKVMGEEIFVEVKCPHYPFVKDINISTSALGIQSAFNKYFRKMVNSNCDMLLVDLLRGLEKEIVVLPVNIYNDNNYSEFMRMKDMSWFERYDTVIKEFKYIGTGNILKTDGSLTHITLRKEDDFGFEHLLSVKLPDDYPSSNILIEDVDLPDSVVSDLQLCKNIKDMFSKFCSAISSLKEFWHVYDNLRQCTWVIDPDKPKKRDTYCRIIIGNNVSILVTLNPINLTSFPDIKFLGADKAIAPFRRKLEKNLKECGWDMKKNLVDNLLIVLGLEEFPLQPTPMSQEERKRSDQDNVLVDDQECCICFTLRNNDDLLPTKICNNDKCTSVVHISCLAQWFQSVAINDPSFNLISGDCPHCGMRIMCPLNVTS